MNFGQTGSGHEAEFGKITGARLITTENSDGIRDGITKRVTSTACGVPNYGYCLAGGDQDRFEELKASPFGKPPGRETDQDYTIVRTHRRKLPK